MPPPQRISSSMAMRTSQIQTVAPFSHPWHQLDCKHFWGKALPLSSASTKPSPVRQATLLGARGKRFLSEVESRRLTKQCWFIKQWILLIIPVFWINSICSEFEQCSVSYLGTNENKGTYKHLPLGHWHVLSEFPFLNYHYRSSLQGQFNNSQDQAQFSDKCCFSCNLIREHHSVVSSHQTHHMCWITRGNNKQQKHDENISFPSNYTHSL